MTFATCPHGAHVILTGGKPAQQKHRQTAKAPDVREPSPLDGISRPAEFSTQVRQSAVPSVESELAQRRKTREEARRLFISNWDDAQIDRIEALFASYRDQKERTASGIWKLTNAYSFLESLYNDWTAANDWQRRVGDSLRPWIARHPKSPAPHIFRASVGFHRAQAMLNDALARKTYAGGAAALLREMTEARLELEANKAVASADPFYYKLIVNSMRMEGRPLDDILSVAMEGIERHPEYCDTYFEAVHTIGQLSKRPFDDLAALANTAVAKSPPTLGDEMYARIYWVALTSIVEPSQWNSIKLDWPKMAKSMETVLSRYPDQWNIQNFAVFSCVMQDHKLTQSLLDRVRGVPLAAVWGQGEFFEGCRQFADASNATGQDENADTRKTGVVQH